MLPDWSSRVCNIIDQLSGWRISLTNYRAGVRNLLVNGSMQPPLSANSIPSPLVFYTLPTAAHAPWFGYGELSAGQRNSLLVALCTLEHLSFWPLSILPRLESENWPALFFVGHGLSAGNLSIFEDAWPISLVPFAFGSVFVQ